MFSCRFLKNIAIPWVSYIKKAPVYRGFADDMFILQKHIKFLADGEGFEPPEELPLQRFSRPSHSTALPPSRNCFIFIRRSFKPAVLFVARVLATVRVYSIFIFYVLQL